MHPALSLLGQLEAARTISATAKAATRTGRLGIPVRNQVGRIAEARRLSILGWIQEADSEGLTLADMAALFAAETVTKGQLRQLCEGLVNVGMLTVSKRDTVCPGFGASKICVYQITDAGATALERV